MKHGDVLGGAGASIDGAVADIDVTGVTSTAGS